jgi:hypothetical protein
MSSFGKNLIIKKRNSPIDEKEMFCGLVDLLENIVLRGQEMFDNYNLNLSEYDEDFYIIIENLLVLNFGEWKTELILWYVWERKNPEGEIAAMEWTNEDTNETKTIILKTSEELWDVLQEIEGKE